MGVAYVAARTNTTAAHIGQVLGQTFVVATLLAPMRWREEISTDAYLRNAALLMPGVAAIFIGAFGHAQGPSFPTAAAIAGFGALHMAVFWLHHGPTAGDLRTMTAWTSAGMGVVTGVWADMPSGLGWNTLAFFMLCLFLGLAMLAVRRLPEDRVTSLGGQY